MPLKLLKRTSKQYNVVSKTTFLISVELLDNGIMECTLDTDSTGADCLLNISQRLGLHQPEFFGLRYISRGVPPRQRWADLERPLKKQLDKYAQDSQLSLGVMYYVADVNLLKDEMTRYHYFLQLKSDVIDGKLNCSIDQAISLAAYSLQAEFGDYDQERHTIDYLRDFAILPKELTTASKYQDINMDALYEAVTRQYGSLIGFPPPLAEIYYIMVAQQLDGYGQTPFPAKDDSGNDILFCASANGLVIRRRDWTHIAAFRFNDIKSLVGHKKTLVVHGSQSQRSIQFHFTDPEVVKYVKKICLLQHAFYKENLKVDNSNTSGEINIHNNSYSIISGNSSTTDQIDAQSCFSSNANIRGTTPEVMSGSSASAIYENQFSLSNNSGSNAGAVGLSNNNMLSPGFNPQTMQQQYKLMQMSNTNMNMNLLLNQQQQINGNSSNDFQQFGRPNSSRSVTPANSGDIYGASGGRGVSPQNGLHNFNLNHPNQVDLQSLLPSYRPAPDYQTAVQLKYGQSVSSGSSSSVNGKVPLNNSGHVYFYGDSNDQEEQEEEPIYENELVSHMHSMGLRETPPEKESNTETRSSTPSVQTNLPVHANVIDDPTSYLHKPPPPYPGTARTSTSLTNFEMNPDGTYSKLKPNLSNHSDVLRQIEAQLKESMSMTNQALTPKSSFAVPQVTKVIGVTSDAASSNTSTNSASKTQSNSRSSKSQEKGSSSKSSYKSSSYSKISEHESIYSPISTVSSSSLGLTGSGSQHSSVNSLSSSKIKSLQHQNRKLSELQKDHSKNKTSLGELYSANIDPNVLKEYESIPKAKPAPDFTTAMLRENSKRNRCPNVLPYEDNTIRLAPSRQNLDGYTNASPVSAVVSGREWKYIVGQIPLAGNIPSLWQMIWETDSKIIAVLERDSTALFYPLDSSTSSSSSSLNTMYFGDFQIVDKGNTTSIAREVTVIYLPKKLQRKVWILPYEDEWKDDVPIHTEHFLCFLEEVNSIQRKVSDPTKPLVVLCGSGAGRCGVLILSDILVHAADSGHKLRCDHLLAELRTQRMLLVSSPAQYAFVLHTLEKYLAQSRLI